MPFRVLSIVLRIAAIVLVVASPWLAPRKRPSDDRSVVYAVDRSASVGETGLEAANAFIQRAWFDRGPVKIGVISFDGSAEVVAPVGSQNPPPYVHMRSEGGKATLSSDLAAAVRLGVAALPREGHRSLVLFTDARPTRGDTLAEVHAATEQGVRVDVVPIAAQVAELPCITAVRPRAIHVAEHHPVAFDVDVQSSEYFTVIWTRDGASLPPVRQYAHAGDERTTVLLTDPNPPPGVHVYEMKVAPLASYGGAFRKHRKGMPAAKDDDDDEKKPREPISVLTAVSVEGSAHAVVFSSAGDVPAVLKTAFAESGLEARPLPLERANDPSSYSGADLVVLADVRVSGAAADDSGLTRAAQAGLIDYVQQGGGLFATGGVFGLAPEYAGTPLARALPVEIEDRGHVEDPPVALAIMLDRSGSMSAPVGGGTHTKIELAIEASLAAAEVLRPTDQVALASVDTETHWDVPLGGVDRVASLKENVRSVTAGGGGIYVYTAMRDAYKALEGVKTPIRHVILFSDTSDSEEQLEGCPYDFGGACKGKTAEMLAREARGKGITTTVVGIGEESAKDTEFLRRVAAAAGGRFYLTSEGADLRRIFLSETRVLAQSNLREKKTTVAAASATHPVLEGINATGLPELSAYVETGRRAGADTALLINDAGGAARLMLATWRYGLGKVGVMTTDFTEGWGGAWASSAESAKLLKQTVRFLLRQHEAHRADASIRIKDRVVEVDIELPPDAPDSAAPVSIDVFAIGEPDVAKVAEKKDKDKKDDKDAPVFESPKTATSHKLTMRLEQKGPGRFIARGRSSGESIIIMRARDARGALMAEAMGQEDRTPELSGVGADTYLVADIARAGEGKISPTVTESLRPGARPATKLVATWPYALIIAAMLVVCDLVFRRLGSRRRASMAAGQARHERIDALAL